MVKIPNMFEENVDYELVPAEGDHWHIRIMTGDFIECLISFGEIKVMDDEGQLNFNFTLHYSPDEDLSVDNVELQKVVGKVLEGILVTNINDMEKK